MTDDPERAAGFLEDLFRILDKKERGFLSRVELAHILEAMMADPRSQVVVPEELKLGGSAKDSRVSFAQLKEYLREWTQAQLEDLKWFAESVVRVEKELRFVWQKSVRRWREKVMKLYTRNLHRYLLKAQPDRVARWLLLRTSTGSQDDAKTGLLGLGISEQEVEVLFTNDTAADIDRCTESIEPFLACLTERDKLARLLDDVDSSHGAYGETQQRIVETLGALHTLASESRHLGCLLIHEDTLQLLTAMAKSNYFSHQVISEVTGLILTLISWNIHTSDVTYEQKCAQMAANYLEVNFDIESLDLEAEREKAHEAQTRRLSTKKVLEQRGEEGLTIADWVGCLLTLQSDFERGEMLDMLVKYDEQRLAGTPYEEEGKEGKLEDVQPSLFSFGKVIPYLLCRLDVSAHHKVHEHRTPLRTHMLKLLLNVLIAAGDRGRMLFRAGRGMKVLCMLIRGNAWGIEREEVEKEEEEDRYEEDGLYRTQQWIWQDPYQSWPYIQSEEAVKDERFYAMDFLDDKFYGSKDRLLAVAVLEHLSTDDMWGKEQMVQEMMQYPYTLQVLCRVRPPCYVLVNLLLNDSNLVEYLSSVCSEIARIYARQAISPVYMPDATCHSLFPLQYDVLLGSRGSDARTPFENCVIEVESRNVVLRVLAFCYHNFMHHLQEERANREGSGPSGPVDAEGEGNEEATQLEAEIKETCKLLASHVPMTVHEIAAVCIAIYLQIEEFTRKALLAVNQLPPVNPDERQKARSLEVAKTVPPRPMYFGHYQMLIYNQSNPTQPTTRQLVSDYEARLKTMHGAADILFTGENRYLSEPSLFPHEFLICVRLVQLIRLREAMPAFAVELQDLLEQLTGFRSSFTFSDAEDDIELAGADYPWRTGLAPLNTFRVSQVPIRASQMKQFQRHSPLAVARSLQDILKEYEALDLWEEETQDAVGQPPAASTNIEEVAQRRNVLLALVFNFLAYYHPKAVTLEDSPQGLSMRLGLSVAHMEAVCESLATASPQDLAVATEPPPGLRHVASPASDSLSLLFVTVEGRSSEVAFVQLKDRWYLWANSCKDNASVLADSSSVEKYFDFMSPENRVP